MTKSNFNGSMDERRVTPPVAQQHWSGGQDPSSGQTEKDTETGHEMYTQCNTSMRVFTFAYRKLIDFVHFNIRLSSKAPIYISRNKPNILYLELDERHKSEINIDCVINLVQLIFGGCAKRNSLSKNLHQFHNWHPSRVGFSNIILGSGINRPFLPYGLKKDLLAPKLKSMV